MKTLIVEDDFTARILMQKLLTGSGEIHVAIDGKEALQAFTMAIEENKPYDLICLDIMMPEWDGHRVLKELRAHEEANNIKGLDGVKVIMATALRDTENIMRAFNGKCEAYLPKPIKRAKLMETIEKLGLPIPTVN